MLLITQANIQPIPNVEMYNMAIKAKHGGMCMISTRYSRIKNSIPKRLPKYFGETDVEFDENSKTVRIYYIDCNQFYPSSMLFKLPVGEYQIIS